MRFAGLLGALALVAAGMASLATPHRDAPARQTPIRAATEPSRVPVALPERRITVKPKADPFAPRDWAPRAPPPPVQAAQEPTLVASAPPNPYRFAGTMHYDGSLKAVFIREEHVHIARPGETLDGGYKLLSVTRDAVTLLYTALDIEQRIALALDPAPEPNGTASVALGSPLAVR